MKAVQPLRKGRTKAPERPPVRPVNDAIVEAVLPHVAAPVAAMIRIQSLTGMRPDEAVRMRGCDLNTTGANWEYRPGVFKLDHHEDAERVVMIVPRAQEALKPWLRTDLEAFLFDPRDSVAGTPGRTSCGPQDAALAVARGREGEEAKGTTRASAQGPLRRDELSARDPSRLRPAFPHPGLSGIAGDDLTDDQRAELAAWRKAHRWSPNRLRHSAATRIRREVGIEAARALLGHSDADTTTIYAERDLELAREAMARLS